MFCWFRGFFGDFFLFCLLVLGFGFFFALLMIILQKPRITKSAVPKTFPPRSTSWHRCSTDSLYHSANSSFLFPAPPAPPRGLKVPFQGSVSLTTQVPNYTSFSYHMVFTDPPLSGIESKPCPRQIGDPKSQRELQQISKYALLIRSFNNTQEA